MHSFERCAQMHGVALLADGTDGPRSSVYRRETLARWYDRFSSEIEALNILHANASLSLPLVRCAVTLIYPSPTFEKKIR